MMKTLFQLALAVGMCGVAHASSMELPANPRSAGPVVVMLDATVTTAISLPQAIAAKNETYELKKVDSTFTAITISPASGELIDGLSNTTLNTTGESVRLYSNGFGWTSMSRQTDTEWATYTPTITFDSGAASNYTSTAKWRRIKDSIQVEGLITFSAAPATFQGPIAALPTGLTFNTAKMTSGAQDTVLAGTMKALDNGISHYITGSVYFRSTSTVYLQPSGTYMANTPTYGAVLTNTYPFSFNSSDTISYNFNLPITGWH